MDIETFLEKFCPDYEEEFNKIKSSHNYDDDIIAALVELREDLFEKALENFTDQICKKQREICGNDAKLYISIDASPYPTDLEEIVNFSFTPNIKEL